MAAFGFAGNPGYVANWYVQQGYPEHVAAAMAGNMMQESYPDIRPTVAGDNGAAFGIAQWNGPRKQALFEFAKERGLDPNSIDTQLAFSEHELRTTEKRARDALMATKTPEEAARVASEKYWRPGEPMMDRRVGYAQDVYGSLSGGSGGDDMGLSLEAMNDEDRKRKGLPPVALDPTRSIQSPMPRPRPEQPKPQSDYSPSDYAQGFFKTLGALGRNEAPDLSEIREKGKRNKTIEWLRKNGSEDIAGMVEAGMISPKEAASAVLGGSEEKTAAMKEYMFAVRQGYDKPFVDFRKELKSGNNVTVNTAGETSYNKERGKALAERMGQIDQEARDARSTLASLDVMEQAMSSPGFYSGFAGETALQAKRALQSLGADVDGIDTAEVFQARAKDAALKQLGGSLGVGFSNADRDFVLEQVPNLSNSPQGNKVLVEVLRRLNGRKIQIANMAREYEMKFGRIDSRFEQQVSDWAEENPLFSGDLFGQAAGAPNVNDPLGIR